MTSGYSGGLVPAWLRLTTSVATSLPLGDAGVIIDSIRVCHYTSTGVTISVTVYDGTTSYFLANAASVLATGFTYDGPFQLSVNETLQFQASDAAGKLDVLVSYRDPRSGRPYGQT